MLSCCDPAAVLLPYVVFFHYSHADECNMLAFFDLRPTFLFLPLLMGRAGDSRNEFGKNEEATTALLKGLVHLISSKSYDTETLAPALSTLVDISGVGAFAIITARLSRSFTIH